jgi:hypothetical protein
MTCANREFFGYGRLTAYERHMTIENILKQAGKYYEPC